MTSMVDLTARAEALAAELALTIAPACPTEGGSVDSCPVGRWWATARRLMNGPAFGRSPSGYATVRWPLFLIGS